MPAEQGIRNCGDSWKSLVTTVLLRTCLHLPVARAGQFAVIFSPQEQPLKSHLLHLCTPPIARPDRSVASAELGLRAHAPVTFLQPLCCHRHRCLTWILSINGTRLALDSSHRRDRETINSNDSMPFCIRTLRLVSLCATAITAADGGGRVLAPGAGCGAADAVAR